MLQDKTTLLEEIAALKPQCDVTFDATVKELEIRSECSTMLEEIEKKYNSAVLAAETAFEAKKVSLAENKERLEQQTETHLASRLTELSAFAAKNSSNLEQLAIKEAELAAIIAAEAEAERIRKEEEARALALAQKKAEEEAAAARARLEAEEKARIAATKPKINF